MLCPTNDGWLLIWSTSVVPSVKGAFVKGNWAEQDCENVALEWGCPQPIGRMWIEFYPHPRPLCPVPLCTTVCGSRPECPTWVQVLAMLSTLASGENSCLSLGLSFLGKMKRLAFRGAFSLPRSHLFTVLFMDLPKHLEQDMTLSWSPDTQLEPRVATVKIYKLTVKVTGGRSWVFFLWVHGILRVIEQGPQQGLGAWLCDPRSLLEVAVIFQVQV